mgnify:CR=1
TDLSSEAASALAAKAAFFRSYRPLLKVVVAEAVAEVRGSGGTRCVATIAHVALYARITPVNIDVLSNCAPVLRADPYSLDNDALAES